VVGVQGHLCVWIYLWEGEEWGREEGGDDILGFSGGVVGNVWGDGLESYYHRVDLKGLK
jgi:hypothetical protein